MKLILMTKLDNGYQPIRIWINPEQVVAVQERFVTRGRGEQAEGAFVLLPDGLRIAVKEDPQHVVCLLQGITQDSFEEWEAKRERIADAVYGPVHD